MSQDKDHRLDFPSIRRRLQTARGPEYWRSLEELADTKEFSEFLHHEFPRFSSAGSAIGRREALKLMAASLALAGLSACTRTPDDKIVPYIKAADELIPGRPVYYATAMPLAGYGTGLLVESHMGRPTKIEGNPLHPASLGASDAFAQASLLTLYDPDRSQAVNRQGRLSNWAAFASALGEVRRQALARKGAGLRILSDTVSSLSLASLAQRLLQDFPEARWHQYEPAGRDAARAGMQMAFGEPLNAVYRPAAAEVVLSLDSNFLASEPGSLRYAREWASRRQPQAGEMSRMYALECTPTVTGAAADHRLPLRPNDVESVARAIAKGIGVATATSRDVSRYQSWIAAVVRDLQRHRGAALVIAGDWQPASVQVLAHAMNAALDSAGKTVFYTDPVEPFPMDRASSLAELVRDMKAGAVDALLILGGNPAFTAPADLELAEALQRVRFRARLGLYEDETSRLCHWHIPEAHYLESWGDVRAFDGTASIIQPLIAPLYQGRSAHEMIAAVLGNSGASGYQIVRDYWSAAGAAPDFEAFWRRSLHDGVIADTASKPRPAALKLDALAQMQEPPSAEGFEIVLRPDPNIFDGRFANNGWLQELPKPLTTLTWDNAALISPRTAEELDVRNGDLVELSHGGRRVRAAAWILPGQPDRSVAAYLGYGRSHAGRVGSGLGFNAYDIRSSALPWNIPGASLRKIAGHYALSATQLHHGMEGRNPVLAGTLEEFRKDPEFVQLHAEPTPRDFSLYPNYPYPGYAWGMAINLNSCIGCNACMVACQAENNIPVVGKQEVARGREMHWIRVDAYHQGGIDNPVSFFQPVPCMHCERAPCEVVCPVAATTHSSEGLNQMVYNRCVGTRYCSNNCPYKVRRFNFYQYSDYETPSVEPLYNPDVSVRGRGVMEKCTYCVQRIQQAKIQAEKEDRRIRDGEVVPACQQACPTQAIVFGNINDTASQVARLKASPLNYKLLDHLNTQPRTTYLAKVTNPNEELEREEG
jgi:molybdopterin-containing oxidoreductase family iron-sulfur binding subunit